MSPIIHSHWDDAVRSRLKAFHKKTIDAATDIIRLAFAMINGEEPVQVGILLQAYIDGVGSYEDSTRFRLKQVTDEVGHRHGLLPPDESFFEHTWSIKRSSATQYCPSKSLQLLNPLSNAGLEAHQILDYCPNELMDFRLPSPLGGSIHRSRRGATHIYSTADAIAYVHPFQYQVLTKDRSSYWISGSPRALSAASIPEVPIQHTDHNLIIIQDRFAFANLCHFVFDGVTRILHYVENFGVSSKDVFILGSIPGEYQSLVCAALSQQCGIPEHNLVFPDRAHLLATSEKCVWFSDQVEGHSHPAQMAHPRSVSLLANLCSNVSAAHSNARRIYVSRGDAERRRITNEGELIAALESRGFISVQLGNMGAREQVGLFRNAEIVVGPHGMGLTHVIMGSKLGHLVELFHPNAGTDAYAYIARAGGIKYDFVVGIEVANTPSDFAVDIKRVIELLGPEEGFISHPSWHKNANLIPSSRTFRDFVSATSLHEERIPEHMLWGQASKWHNAGLGRTEAGRWPHMLITENKMYTLSCWVFIPHDFEGAEVWIQIGEWPETAHCSANLEQRQTWQRLWYTAQAPAKDRCWAELHIRGSSDSMVASTCWQLEHSDRPTTYVSTG